MARLKQVRVEEITVDCEAPYRVACGHHDEGYVAHLQCGHLRVGEKFQYGPRVGETTDCGQCK